jgi:cleavage and polyadenylation specificity factor subunit 1
VQLADLGDHVAKEPHMVARNTHNDLTIYKLFRPGPSTSALSFLKLSNPVINTPRTSAPATPYQPMIILPNISGYASVFLPGADPAFLLKTAQSTPHLHRLAGTSVRSLASFHTSSADRGFIYIDALGIVRVSLLPTEYAFSGPWSARKIPLSQSLRAITYFAPMSVYVGGTTTRVPFTLDTEDGAPDPVEENTFYPTVEHSSLVIINPRTWTIVDTHPFAHNEVALVVTAIPMEISEHTHERRTLIAVGTGIFRGEDHSARGCIYVFEVIEVVPEPGRPETNRKLKLVVREEVKGTVSAICGVNGYLLAAQGQKVMVRGLKEDQSLLPVAFLDMNSYVSVAKNLDGMLLFGDFVKSAWFAGFSEEPYKMTLFGKDAQGCEVVAAEFLPDGEVLKFILADAQGNLLVLQYDPERTLPPTLPSPPLIYVC